MSVAWGILSTARINRAFETGVAASSLAHLEAVASRDGARAADYAQRWGIPRAFGSYEDMLRDSAIEAVYISLPNSLHLEWTVKALRAGKHVLCEKPLSARAEDVAAAFDLAEQGGCLLMEGFMYRHHPQTLRLKALVSSGTVGKVRLIRSSFSFRGQDPADVRLSRHLDGGGLMDVGCYCVNATRLLAGEPQRVSAVRVTGGDGVDVALAGTMEFGGDVIAHFDCGIAIAPRDELEIVGEEGSLFLDDPWHCVNPRIEIRRNDGRVDEIVVERADSYRLEAEDLSRAVRGEGRPLLGRDDAVGQARVIQALHAAATGARCVEVTRS